MPDYRKHGKIESMKLSEVPKWFDLLYEYEVEMWYQWNVSCRSMTIKEATKYLIIESMEKS